MFLAWQDIAGSEERLKQRDLSYQQITQAKQKFKDADDTVNLRIAGTYQWVLTPAQREATGPITLEETRADTTREWLAERVSDRLHRDDRLRTVQGARLIRDDLDQFLARAWSAGHVQVGKLWEWYCQYVYLPRLRDRSVLEAGYWTCSASSPGKATGSRSPLAMTKQLAGTSGSRSRTKTTRRRSPI